MGAVIQMPNPRASQTVRNAVNERARIIGAPESKRLQAVGRGLTLLKLGRSTACAISEACRDLRAAAPSLYTRGPTPPAAA